MRKEVIAHTCNCTKNEIDILFGPMTGKETIIILEPTDTLAHVLHKANLIKSLSWGKQNGFTKEIPLGFSSTTFGKLKHNICIFKKL